MNCTTCHQPIPAGLAVIRSVSFQRVTFHSECWEAGAAVFVPTQRVAGDVREKVAG